MSEGAEKHGDEAGERSVGDTLRDAIERTLQATAGSAATTRERAGELVDELARRGHEARGELTRRGQEARGELARRGQVAGAELAKRGQDAGAELGRRLELLERRLAEVERDLRTQAAGGAAEHGPEGAEAQSKAED